MSVCIMHDVVIDRDGFKSSRDAINFIRNPANGFETGEYYVGVTPQKARANRHTVEAVDVEVSGAKAPQKAKKA